MKNQTLLKILTFVPIVGYLVSTYSLASNKMVWRSELVPIITDIYHTIFTAGIILYFSN